MTIRISKRTREQLAADYGAGFWAGRILCPVVDALRRPLTVTLEYHISNEAAGQDWAAGYHTGEDHACPDGSLALAVTYGEVVEAGDASGSWGPSYGTFVLIRTGDGAYDYGLCHLSSAAVKVGDKVVPGQIVGRTGHSGNVTGPHLHFEARTAGGRYGDDVRPLLVKQRRG